MYTVDGTFWFPILTERYAIFAETLSCCNPQLSLMNVTDISKHIELNHLVKLSQV